MLIDTIKDFSPISFTALRDLPHPFILSCASGRYSILSADPIASVRTDKEGTKVCGRGKERKYKDPFAAISDVLSGFKYSGEGRFPFNCGGVGYFSYDLKSLIEPGIQFRKNTDARLDLPDCIFGFYDPVLVYDREKKTGYIVSTGDERERFGRFKEMVTGPEKTKPVPEVNPAPSGFSSNLTKEGYIGLILKAKEYISSGDIYQINLSQRLSIPWEGDPFALYLRLTETHPAPFSSFLDFGGFQIISNSPERLIKVKDGYAETSPIKGTRPRGLAPSEDRAFMDELKKSTKERAEHVMIVDLERNDIGRISLPGTVEVTGFEAIETFPHLHHMISTVRGRLKPGTDPPAALKSVFPGGSVTGAPKIRAMEIIDELEPAQRGVYTGGIGWIDFNGDMDIAMAIRTAVYKDKSLYLNVGGGIVADSIPEEEYKETILKARDFLEALGAYSRE